MRKGQVIIAAIFVLAIIAILAMVAVALLSGESVSAVKNYHGIQALNVAEGGMRFTIATSLAADSDWSNNSDFGPVSLNPGTFTVHYITKAKKTCSLEVTGTVQGVNRTVRSSFDKGGGGGFGSAFTDYVGYGGSGASTGNELLFNNNARCYGTLQYFGPVRFTSNTKQSGGVIRSISISPLPAVGIPTNYASWEQISTFEPVTFDPTYYQNWLDSANVSTADALTGNAGTINLAGGTRYYRYVDISSGTINGPGTICATNNPSGGGRFEVTGSVKINGPVRIISRGSSGNGVTFAPTSPNPIFNGSIEVIANRYIYVQNKTMVSPESILYAKYDDGKYGIQIEDDSWVKGSSLICPTGVLRIMNDSTVEGIMYTESLWSQDYGQYFGTSWVFLNMLGGSQIKDWSILTQTLVGMPSSLPPGLSFTGGGSSSGEFTSSGWGEYY